MKSNKIMLLTPGLKRAGQEKVVYELAIGFKSRGYKVEVASFYGGPYKEELESNDIKVNLISQSISNTSFSKIRLFINFINLVKNKSDFNFLFHGIGFEKLWILYSLMSYKKIFSVFVFHNNYPFINSRKLNFKKLQLKLFLNFVDKVVFIKKTMMLNTFKSDIILANNNVKVIENGIEIPKLIKSKSRLKSLKSNLGFKTEDIILIQVGRFADQKNQLISIKALELLKNKIPEIKLVLLGEGKNMKLCKNYVLKANLNNRVFFKGSVSNVKDYLSISDLFLMPSDFEGHPIALIEAMMLELRAVVYKAPGIKEFLPKDIDILNYIIPRTPTQMCNVISSILLNKNSQLENKLFLKACNWVRENYSQDKMVQEYINLLK